MGCFRLTFRYGFVPGQIILGKFAGQFLGHLDDRPLITIAGARAGKTSTILEPNLYLYPGSMLILDPKGELSHTAMLRQALGHNVYVLDPLGQSRQRSACFNALAELDPESWTVVDDVASIAQSLIVDDGDTRSKHWIDSARTLLSGLILLTLMFPEEERSLVTVRELLCLTSPGCFARLKREPVHPKTAAKANSSITKTPSRLTRFGNTSFPGSGGPGTRARSQDKDSMQSGP